MKDLLQGKPFGHPLHPILVHFPVGLFVLSLLLDLAASYRRLNARGNWIYRYLTARWPDALHRRFAT